jgi:hypothetical protein
MITASTAPSQEGLQFTLIIAYDSSTGRVFGTSVHGSFDERDETGIELSRQRLLDDLAAHSCDPLVSPATLEMALQDLPAGLIDRIDPATEMVVMHPATGRRLPSCDPEFRAQNRGNGDWQSISKD